MHDNSSNEKSVSAIPLTPVPNRNPWWDPEVDNELDMV